MATPEEIQAKSEATRLKNLLARKADKEKLSKGDEAVLKTLKAKAKKAKAPRNEQHNWFTEPASPKWTGRKIKNKTTGKEYVIGDVFGERHVEMEKEAKTTIHNAANLRESYEPI